MKYVKLRAKLDQVKIRKILKKGVDIDLANGDLSLETYTLAPKDSKVYVKKSVKSFADEIWRRVFSGHEESEQFTEEDIKKLKNNFYGMMKPVEKMWRREKANAQNDVYIKL